MALRGNNSPALKNDEVTRADVQRTRQSSERAEICVSCRTAIYDSDVIADDMVVDRAFRSAQHGNDVLSSFLLSAALSYILLADIISQLAYYVSFITVRPRQLAYFIYPEAHFWPTVLSVVPLVHCVVCLSVCDVLYCGKTVRPR